MGTTVRFDLPQQTQQFNVVQRRYPDIARLIEDVGTADRRGPGMTRLLRPETLAAMKAVMAAYPVLWKAVCKVLPVLADPELARVYAQFAWTYPKLEAAMAAVFEARRINPNAAVRSPLVDPILRVQYGEGRVRFPELAETFESFINDPLTASRTSILNYDWLPGAPALPTPLTTKTKDDFPLAGKIRPYLLSNETFALRERSNGKHATRLLEITTSEECGISLSHNLQFHHVVTRNWVLIDRNNDNSQQIQRVTRWLRVTKGGLKR